MEKRKRNISKILRLSAEEAKNLADNANSMGIDESSYLRRLIGQRPEKILQPEPIERTIKALSEFREICDQYKKLKILAVCRYTLP